MLKVPLEPKNFEEKIFMSLFYLNLYLIFRNTIIKFFGVAITASTSFIFICRVNMSSLIPIKRSDNCQALRFSEFTYDAVRMKLKTRSNFICTIDPRATVIIFLACGRKRCSSIEIFLWINLIFIDVNNKHTETMLISVSKSLFVLLSSCLRFFKSNSILRLLDWILTILLFILLNWFKSDTDSDCGWFTTIEPLLLLLIVISKSATLSARPLKTIINLFGFENIAYQKNWH